LSFEIVSNFEIRYSDLNILEFAPSMKFVVVLEIENLGD
jgi:hypothetical protein